MNIVGILGSPSVSSRSGSLLDVAQSHLSRVATRLHTLALRELPPEALLHAQFGHPQVQAALEEVRQAQVVLICTPIYKAAYSGLLKTFLDLLPQDGLRDKTVLPLATGGSLAHLLALDYGLKPVLSALGARDILDPVFATDTQIAKLDGGVYQPSADVQARVARALEKVVERAEAFERQEAAAQAARDAASWRLGEASRLAPAWQARDVRWST